MSAVIVQSPKPSGGGSGTTDTDNQVLKSLIKIVVTIILLGGLGYGGYQLYLFIKKKLEEKDQKSPGKGTSTSSPGTKTPGGGGGGGDGGGGGGGGDGGNAGDGGDEKATTSPPVKGGAIFGYILGGILILWALFETLEAWRLMEVRPLLRVFLLPFIVLYVMVSRILSLFTYVFELSFMKRFFHPKAIYKEAEWAATNLEKSKAAAKAIGGTGSGLQKAQKRITQWQNRVDRLTEALDGHPFLQKSKENYTDSYYNVANRGSRPG